MTQKQLKELVTKYQPTAKETSREELSELLEAEGVEGKDLEKVLDELYAADPKSKAGADGDGDKGKENPKGGEKAKSGETGPGAKAAKSKEAESKDHFEEWLCDFSGGKPHPIKVLRPVVKITQEEADNLNHGIANGGNQRGSYYFKSGEVPK